MINVAKTYLPDKEKYIHYVEKRLAEYLGVKNIVLVANGTIALEIAYRTLNIKDDAITTPFSFVVTTTSLLTNALKPIFANALKFNQYFKSKLSSSEGMSYCNFQDDEIHILPYVTNDSFLDNNIYLTEING